MKTKITFLLLSISVVSCRTQHDVVVERHIERDTIYQDRLQLDSVYVEHNITTDRSTDTIIIHEREVLTRYRIVHDSIYVAKVDTIHHTETIEKRENIPRYTTRIMIFLSFFSAAFVCYRVYRHYK